MIKELTVFFRNDDVRNRLDNSLSQITDLFIKYNIPICHAVEPANVTQEVVDWLNYVKKMRPDLIEIIQHGFDHKIKNKSDRGEFGRKRTYNEQFHDIKLGQELMNKYFDNSWFEAFSFPYGIYNSNTLTILDKLNFKVISTGLNSGVKRRIFNEIGWLLNKKFLYKQSDVRIFGIIPPSTYSTIGIN